MRSISLRVNCESVVVLPMPGSGLLLSQWAATSIIWKIDRQTLQGDVCEAQLSLYVEIDLPQIPAVVFQTTLKS